MGDGLKLATLATYVGKKHAVRWGARRVTIGAVGRDGNGPWAMGTLSDGTTVLGDVSDFTIPEKRRKTEELS